MSKEPPDWAKHVCDSLKNFCGGATPCMPGFLEAIEAHDWVKAASLMIEANECSVETEVIIPVLAFSAIACLFSDAGHPLTPEQSNLIDHEMRGIRAYLRFGEL